MKYEILEEGCSRTKKGCLKITDNTGDSFTVPKKFRYLKLVENEDEDADEEYQFSLCNKKGKALSDYKEYNKIDDKFKYISTEIIDEDEIDLEELCDEEHIFSIKPSKANSKIPAIFNIKGNVEMGTLSDFTSTEEGAPTSTGGQDYESKIVTSLSTYCGGNQSVPDAFNEDGSFKYLNKIDNMDFKSNIDFKGPFEHGHYLRKYITSSVECANSCGPSDRDEKWCFDSKPCSRNNLREFFTDHSRAATYIYGLHKSQDCDKSKPIMYVDAEDFLFQVTDRKSGKVLFESHLDHDIPIYVSDYML